jgi:hypothetical protein
MARPSIRNLSLRIEGAWPLPSVKSLPRRLERIPETNSPRLTGTGEQPRNPPLALAVPDRDNQTETSHRPFPPSGSSHPNKARRSFPVPGLTHAYCGLPQFGPLFHLESDGLLGAKQTRPPPPWPAARATAFPPRAPVPAETPAHRAFLPTSTRTNE